MDNESGKIGKLLTHAIHSTHSPPRPTLHTNGKFKRKGVNKTRDGAEENIEWIGKIALMALMATYFLPES